MVAHVTLLFCLLFPAHAQDKLTAKFHPVEIQFWSNHVPGSNTAATDPFGVPDHTDSHDAILRELREIATLPDTTTLKLFPGFAKLYARTTPAGHERLTAALRQLEGPSSIQIAIDFTLVSLASNQVYQSEVFRRTGSLDTKEVLRIFRDGHASVISLDKIITLSGVNAQVESVEEIMYPTEFEIEKTKSTDGAIAPPVRPGAFETRETGHILNVTPTISPNLKTIQLAIIPETARLIGWIDYEPKQPGETTTASPNRKGRFAQPVFRSTNFTTSIVVRDGETAVIGGALHPETKEPMYALVTARTLHIKKDE